MIEPDLHEDERGFFARVFCTHEMEQHGLNGRLSQCNISFNRKRGTLRGLHYQASPFAECKLVQCGRGAVFDVLVDLRAGSPTYRQWISVELTELNRRMVYIPEGVAHGFQTLRDDTQIWYYISESYHPEAARGVRWDDPAFAIRWPVPDPIMNERDRNYALVE